MHFSLLAVVLSFALNFNVSAQSQDHMWCQIIKVEMSIIQQQKSAGFRLEDSSWDSGSYNRAIKDFKFRVAKIIYTTSDSGAKYLTSNKFTSDCLKSMQ